MTIQAVPQVGGLLLFLVPGFLVGLIIIAAIQLASRRQRAAARFGAVALAVILLYAGALLGTGISSNPQELKVGDTKCFDDWCATMTAAQRGTGSVPLRIYVRLENRGRGRAMKSDLARAYLEVQGGRRFPARDSHLLQTVIDAGGHVDIHLDFDMPPGSRRERFIVAEGIDALGPGTFTIGDEASPLHAIAGWPLDLT